MSVLLGLRLAVAGGRAAWARLALTTIGVGIGVTLLLLSLTVQSAVEGRADRSAWQHTTAQTPASAPDPALSLIVTDYYAGEPMMRVYVAALGPRPPVPPGLDRLSAPGEVAVSPAMRRLLAATPDDQLDDRFPGRVAATIGPSGLSHPDQLVAVVGQTPEQMRQISGAQQVRGIETVPTDYAFTAILRVFAAALTVLLLVPVVVFIVMVTRLAAVRREQRLAAIRLVGATRLQTALAAAAETLPAAAVGTALGWIGYQAGRRLMASGVSWEGARFFADDIVVSPDLLLLVLGGVPVLIMATTVMSLYRVQVSPLGIGRRARRGLPTAWRAVPVTVGIGGLLVVGWFREAMPGDVNEVAEHLLVCAAVGVVIVGPWACLVLSRALGRVARRTPALIAARRIAADPRTTFRAVSGVGLAVFAATFFGSVVSAAGDVPGADVEGALRPGVIEVYAGRQPETVLAPLISDQTVVGRIDARGRLVMSCADLARVVIVSCPLPASLAERGTIDSNASTALSGVGVVSEPGPGAASLPVRSLYLITDGTPAAQERARTQATTVLQRAIVHTQQDRELRETRFWNDRRTVIRLGTLFIVLVAACSLTVSAIGGLIERRRPFALLRASGVRLGELRSILLLETGLPMVLISLLGVGLGLAASYAFYSIDGSPWSPPGLDLAVSVGGGVLATFAISACALPLLNATTRYDTVRYE